MKAHALVEESRTEHRSSSGASFYEASCLCGETFRSGVSAAYAAGTVRSHATRMNRHRVFVAGRPLDVRIHRSYWADVPELPGCFATGDTKHELMANLREAIALVLADESDRVFRESGGAPDGD